MKRAQTQAQKEDRKLSILATAAMLFERQSGTFPSVQKIADTSGIAKGTIYLYFKTKEDIFLALIEDYYKQWLEKIAHSTSTCSPLRIEVIIEELVDFLVQTPLFFQLSSHSCSIELGNSDDNLLHYKKNLALWLDDTSQELAKVFTLKSNQTSSWLLDSFAYLSGLWQLSFPPDNVSRLLEENHLTIFLPKFKQKANEVLLVLWNHQQR